MPTISTMNLPRSKDFNEFESMCRAAMALRWESPNLQKNGRPGQAQHGVDIFGPDRIGRPVAIQCKNYASPPTLSVVKAEIANARRFKGRLDALFIATSADHDSKLQQEVRLLSEKRVAAGKFAVAMIFWDEIVDGLALNPQTVKNFYPQLTLPTPGTIDRGRLIGALELGYYGPFLWDYVKLLFGEYGWMAQEDTDQIEVILRIVEQRVAQLLDEADAQVIRDSLAKVRKGCRKREKTQRVWSKVEAHAQRIANRVRNAPSLLPTEEGAALDLGRGLGAIYIHEDDAPDQQTRERVRNQFVAIAPNAAAAMHEAMDRVAGDQSGYAWAPSVYTRVIREFRLLSCPRLDAVQRMPVAS